MFIDLSANSEPTRSEERDSSRASPLQNFPAPPNGAGGVLLPIYKHVTPHWGETRFNADCVEYLLGAFRGK
jgi:hypothetical protein